MIELTEKEIKMVEAFRSINEIPVNVLLWYMAGLEDSCNKIRHISPKQAEYDDARILAIRDAMNDM